MFTSDQLQDYANSLDHGYLKAWKANSMVRTFTDIVRFGDDKNRTIKWVKNCLEMEGFWHDDCVKINEWMWSN